MPVVGDGSTDDAKFDTGSEVRIWLGESADDSDVAMDFINRIDMIDFEDPNFELDPDVNGGQGCG